MNDFEYANYIHVVQTLFAGVMLGIVTGLIAQKKGASFMAWWLFGALLFIVALPMVLLMEPKLHKGMAVKRCPYCGKPMKTSVMQCPDCRRAQPEIGAATAASWQKTRTDGDEVAKWAKEQGMDKDN